MSELEQIPTKMTPLVAKWILGVFPPEYFQDHNQEMQEIGSVLKTLLGSVDWEGDGFIEDVILGNWPTRRSVQIVVNFDGVGFDQNVCKQVLEFVKSIGIFEVIVVDAIHVEELWCRHEL